MGQVSGKVAFITGGAAGIGAARAESRRLAEANLDAAHDGGRLRAPPRLLGRDGEQRFELPSLAERVARQRRVPVFFLAVSSVRPASSGFGDGGAQRPSGKQLLYKRVTASHARVERGGKSVAQRRRPELAQQSAKVFAQRSVDGGQACTSTTHERNGQRQRFSLSGKQERGEPCCGRLCRAGYQPVQKQLHLARGAQTAHACCECGRRPSKGS